MVDLSESAKTILRHFKVRGMHEKDYETPAALGQLFNDPQECESAEAELVTAGLVDLAAGQTVARKSVAGVLFHCIPTLPRRSPIGG